MQRMALLSVKEDQTRLGAPIETVEQLTWFLQALGLPSPEFVGRTEILVLGLPGEAQKIGMTHEPQRQNPADGPIFSGNRGSR